MFVEHLSSSLDCRWPKGRGAPASHPGGEMRWLAGPGEAMLAKLTRKLSALDQQASYWLFFLKRELSNPLHRIG